MNHVAVKRLCACANGTLSLLSPVSRESRLKSASGLFEGFSPKGFLIATSLTETFFKQHPSLERVTSGVWPSITFDLGPQTVTSPQQRELRRIICWWWIAITALGKYDPDRGGHLILWDLGRVLRFPPGSTVLLPAILRYSIAAIQPGETRYSITQYAPAPPAWSRWPAATHLFSKLHELSSLRT
ncbi:hypothetical protein B0H11DRAFT_1754815 [Mycena galericulata]|nr:hypothetical protein B0H11DRAFT_1754815 [Mycena galericulata]